MKLPSRAMFFGLWPRQKPTVTPGLFIPDESSKTLATPAKRALIVRPTQALTIVTMCLCVWFGWHGYTAATARLVPATTQPATPIIVLQTPEPYTQTVVSGAHEALHEQATFERVVATLSQSTSTVLAVDTVAGTMTVYQSAVAVLTAPLQAVADDTSWYQLSAGVYAVTATQPNRYSSLRQAYYPYSIAIGNTFSIHGKPQTVTGEPILEHEPLGVMLAASDMEAVYTLVSPGTPVVVRTPAAKINAFSYTPKSPVLPVRSYLVADLQAGELLMQEATTTVPVASLTKLMTAVVVAEEFSLEDDVRLIGVPGVTTTIPRLAGADRISVYDLLQLLLLESSNEAAEALAAQFGREAFIERMNVRAQQLGMVDTEFTDPSGLDDANISTAADMLRLVQHITTQQPFIWSLTNASAKQLSAFHDLENYNEVAGLTTFRGGKVGETAAAKLTSVTLHDIQIGDAIRTIAIIVLGSEARDRDVTRLHDMVTTQYTGR